MKRRKMTKDVCRTPALPRVCMHTCGSAMNIHSRSKVPRARVLWVLEDGMGRRRLFWATRDKVLGRVDSA